MLLGVPILGHLKIINFTFGSNGKFIAFRCPNIGTPKIINFTFGSNGKFIAFRYPNTLAHYSKYVLCLLGVCFRNCDGRVGQSSGISSIVYDC